MPIPRFAVFGHPVAHSRSPRIHATFGEQLGIELGYERIDASPEAFAQAARALHDEGAAGANVTAPLKELAHALCIGLGPHAQRAGAVNTLVRTAGGWHGENTDGIGLVRDLRERHGIALEAARVLVLGAGGATAGIVPALLDARVGGLWIANRTVARAQQLVQRLHDPRLRLAPWMDGGMQPVDIVVNATSAARGAATIPLPPELAATTVVHLGYGDAAEAWLQLARDAGCTRAVDGLGMLVEQAAESFRLWHGVMPDTAPVYAMLRAPQ